MILPMAGKSDRYPAAFIVTIRYTYKAPGINDCLTLSNNYPCPIIPLFTLILLCENVMKSI